MAIIPLGDDNEHHHPHRSTLQRLAVQGVRIDLTNPDTTARRTPEDPRRLRSIVNAYLVITTDGASYEVSPRRSFTADGP